MKYRLLQNIPGKLVEMIMDEDDIHDYDPQNYPDFFEPIFFEPIIDRCLKQEIDATIRGMNKTTDEWLECPFWRIFKKRELMKHIADCSKHIQDCCEKYGKITMPPLKTKEDTNYATDGLEGAF